MTAAIDASESHNLIRRRLFWLLMQAFLVVVSLTVLVLVGLLAGLAGVLTREGSGYTPPEVRELEAYYLGHNGWDGVGALLAQQNGNSLHSLSDVVWGDATVLDNTNRIVIESGRADGPEIGQLYPDSGPGARVPVIVNHVQVGQAIFGL